MTAAHSPLGPSGAETWIGCPGSVNAQRGLPDDTSEFAAEGTAAHEVADLCLTLGFEPHDLIGTIWKVDGFAIEVEDDMAEALSPGIDWSREYPGTFYGEHKVDLSHWLGEGQFGTLDRGWTTDDSLAIGDLKYGRGIPISPVENKQLMLYALGFWKAKCPHITDPDFPIRLVIDQPRCVGGGGEWMTTLGRLWEFGEEARAAALATEDPNAPRIASAKACQWCKRRKAPGGCETYDEFNLDMLGLKFDDLDDEEIMLPRMLTPERRSIVLAHKSMITNWLETLHTDCLTDALRGDPTGNLKAVEGRKGADKWYDKSAAEDALMPILGEDRFTKKLKSPTQVGKELSPEDMKALDSLIERGTKKPILVPEADARPAIQPVETKFDEEE